MCEIDYGNDKTTEKFWYYFETYTDLHRAVYDEDIDKVRQELTKSNKAINQRENFQGDTPLCIASCVKNNSLALEICVLLVENGADATICNNFGRTPFSNALTLKNYTLINRILSCFIEDKDNVNYLKKCSFEIIKKLMENKDDGGLYFSSYRPENKIQETDKIELSTIFKTILEKHGAIDSIVEQTQNRSLLHLAADFPFLVQIILEFNPDVDKKCFYNITPLIMAAKCGNFKTVKLLVENGADVNLKCSKYKSTALHWACEAHNKQIVKYLLTKGANVNAFDSTNRTPIFWACEKEDNYESDEFARVSVVKHLLKHNPDLNIFVFDDTDDSESDSSDFGDYETNNSVYRKKLTIIETAETHRWAYKYHENSYPKEGQLSLIDKYLAKSSILGYKVMKSFKNSKFYELETELIAAKKTPIDTTDSLNFFDILICEKSYLIQLLRTKSKLINALLNIENELSTNSTYLETQYPNFSSDIEKKIKKLIKHSIT